TRQTMGEIEVAGYRLPKEAASIRQRLGVVNHQPLLYGDLTAEENLLFYSKLYGLDRAQARVSETLELVGLSARRSDLVRTFSRGMQQRLSIGRAVIHEPEILLLDEPHTGLDQDACTMLDTLLKKVAANQRTVIMTTHDMARAENLASRFDILSRGRLLASAPRESIPGDGLLAFYRQVLEAPQVPEGGKSA
ncbi:MAG: ABC transporter ATP-binding protein, partial [Anaerolineaceae bacterium]|nr:ABC transporter ATP-binding protein [Anaerolineaceae bacterium]